MTNEQQQRLQDINKRIEALRCEAMTLAGDIRRDNHAYEFCDLNDDLAWQGFEDVTEATSALTLAAYHLNRSDKTRRPWLKGEPMNRPFPLENMKPNREEGSSIFTSID